MSGRGSQLKTHIGSVVDSIRGHFRISDRSLGYTVVEVMIFLAVTTALFVMIIGTFSGKQAGAEFSTAARDMESRMQDIANDVSTGFYNNPGTFSCSVNLSRVPQISTLIANQQGTNRDCTFIGRVAQFAVSGNNKQYNLFTVVGARLGSDGKDTDELGEANPRALTLPNLIEDTSMPVGLVTHSVWADDGAGNKTPISAVGFFTTFGSGPSGESSLTVDIVPLGDGNDSATDIATAIAGITSTSAKNPNGGILVCMNGDATRKHAVLRLGSSRGRLTTDIEIGENTCTSAGF